MSTGAAALLALTVPMSLSSPAGAATTNPDFVTLLVGSPHVAVYELTHADSTGALPSTDGPYQLVARAATGTRDRYPLGEAQKSLDSLRWSVSGDMLTAVDAVDDATVDWWDLATHASGTITIPTHSYVAASPLGVLYLTKGGRLAQRTPAGITTVLSRPFTKRPSHMTGRSSDIGVLISDLVGRARYLLFSHPGDVRHLNTKGAATVACSALGTRYAACTTRGTLHGRPTGAALLSLRGKPPAYAGDRDENFGQVGLLGTKTVAWTRFRAGSAGVGHGPYSTVGSLTRGARHRVIAKHVTVAFGQMITAYGKLLVMPRKRHRILASSDGKTFTTIVKVPSS
jgi:hypothetical protein